MDAPTGSGNESRERWTRIEQIVDVALELPPAERAAYFALACERFPAARERIEALVRALEEDDTFLARPAVELAAPLLPSATERLEVASEGSGSRVGPYLIVDLLGRGGMGAVYLADRADGEFQRRVALKLLIRGRESPALLGRARAERQILAGLHHPNIAPLLDGGVTTDGRPWFAMELVQGVPITRHCDERRLTVRERLTLFVSVGDAVSYAHRRLVIHRDIKPSNVFVSGEGIVKLLDFGIAKLLQEDDSHSDSSPAPGTRLLTPDYAAPEQFRGEEQTIATDVYGLGGLLYELLTGRRAHRFAARDSGEVRRVICENVPAAPSDIVLRPAAESDGVAAGATADSLGDARRTSPRALARALRGDLDAIVARALEKDPTRRYPSADAMLEDVRHHLALEPVQARPSTWRYRLSRFVRRQRIAAAALGAGLTALVIAAVMATAQFRVASRELSRSREVTEFLVGLFREADPSLSPNQPISASELLARAAARLDTSLASERVVRADLLALLGDMYLNLGRAEQNDSLIDVALRLRQRADVADDPGLAATLRELARSNWRSRDFAVAESLQVRALAIDRALGTSDSAVAADLVSLGHIRNDIGRLAAADSAYEAALPLLERAIGTNHDDTYQLVMRLAELRVRRGLDQQALPLARRAAAHRLDPSAGALRYSEELVDSLLRVGLYFEADSILTREIDAIVAKSGLTGTSLATALEWRGTARLERGDFAGAAEDFRAAFEARTRMLADHRMAPRAAWQWASALRLAGRLSAAELVIRRELARERTVFGGAMGGGWLELGRVLEARGAQRAADSAYRVAHEGDLPPLDVRPQPMAALALGRVLVLGGRPSEAEPMLRGALASLLNAEPRNPREIAGARTVLGACLTALGHYELAERELLASVDEYGSDDSRSWRVAQHRSTTWHAMVELYERWGKPEQAARYRAGSPSR